jgi:hypothetical protein
MSAVSSAPSHRGPALLAGVVFVLAAVAALGIDVPRAGYGIKSDEATYVTMALSIAFDGDVSYQRRDFERFVSLYHQGPEGIFLKRGRELRLSVRPPFPYVHQIQRADPQTDRAYFGKAFVYPLFAAPFVRLWGLNGMLLFHVLLLTLVAVCGYLFLAAQSAPLAAATFTAAFLGAAALPVYGVFLMPEVFNFSLVFFAYFLWLYKEVRGGSGAEAQAAPSRRAVALTDVAAAVLLGLATYSKPIPVIFLIAPPVAFAWWRREWLRGLLIGTTAVLVTVACFGLTAATAGDFNYQGGRDRQAFYRRFPFDAPGTTWDQVAGTPTTTDGTAAAAVLRSPEAPARFLRNVKYFLAGRHFGFLPYYFPGVVAVTAWLLSRRRRDAWRVLIFGAFITAAVGLLLVLPFTWSGGGGPPGNRYLLSAYPVLFFLAPPMHTAWTGVLAWIGGALFTAKILVSPFTAAKFTWELTEKGPARWLPVEVTMAQDLPVMLAQPTRGRVQYGHDPFLLLYFLDQNAWPPEPDGMWVSGLGRADIIVRAVNPIQYLSIEAQAPVANTLSVSLGGETVNVSLRPHEVVRFEVPGAGVRDQFGYAYLMTVRASQGVVPHAMNPESSDYRNLGAQLRFSPVSEQP